MCNIYWMWKKVKKTPQLICHGILTFHGFQVTGEIIWFQKLSQKNRLLHIFVTPTGDPNEKLDAMISSDTLPDLITLGWWESGIDQMINEGKVYALDELSEKYDTYFMKVVDDAVVSWHKSDDGHLYKYPNSACAPSDYSKYDNLASNETF